MLTDGTYTRDITPPSTDNLAYNRPVVNAGAGSISGRGPCAPSVDNAGATNLWTCGNGSLPTSFVIDLGQSFWYLAKLIFWSYWQGDNRWVPASGSIDYSTDNVNWTNNVASWSGKTVDPIILTLPGTPGCRYLRVNITGGGSGGSVQIAGLQIFGKWGSPLQQLDMDVQDGATYARPTYNQTYGGTRAYNAIDGSNIVVAGGLDFGRAYTGKGALATVNNLDGVPDGGSYYRTSWWQRDGGGRGYYGLDTSNMVVAGGIDFSRAYTNKNTDYILEGGNKYAGEHGADITGSHTAYDTSYVYGSWSGYVGAGGVRGYNAIDTSNIVLAGSIDFGRGYTNKNLDNISDGTRVAWGSGSQRDSAVDGSGNLRLKNVGDVIAATTSPSYTSGTYTTISEMTQTITTRGNKVLLLFTATLQNAAGTGTIYIAFFRDGGQLNTDYPSSGLGGAVSTVFALTMVDDSASAGLHTFDVRVKLAGGARALFFATARRFQVVELG